MFTLHLGRPPHNKTISVPPAWLLIPVGLALSAVIGLFQGTFQSTTLALALAGMGLALLWLGLVVAKPEVALLLYTLLAVNLNSINLPLPLGGVRVSPDIVLVSLLIVGVLLRLLATRRPTGPASLTGRTQASPRSPCARSNVRRLLPEGGPGRSSTVAPHATGS